MPRKKKRPPPRPAHVKPPAKKKPAKNPATTTSSADLSAPAGSARWKPRSSRSTVVESRTLPVRRQSGAIDFTITLQRELVLCGRKRCRKLHGPYWYAYVQSDRRVLTVYVGRELDVGKAITRMRAKLREG